MWSSRYWTPRFFDSRYWSASGATVTVTVTPLGVETILRVTTARPVLRVTTERPTLRVQYKEL